MTTPITSDKIPTSTNPKASGPDGKSTGKNIAAEQETSTTTSEASAPTDDTVNVDRATQLYRSAGSEPTESRDYIESSEQAHQLAARITEQFAENSAQALDSQAGVMHDHIGTLLSTAP